MNTKLSLTKKLLLTAFCGAIILCCASIQTAFAQDDSKEDPRIERYKMIEARLMEGVKAGKISKEDAEKRLVAARMEIFSEKEDPRMEKYRKIEARLKEGVKAGKISKEDADKRLIAARKEIFRNENVRKAPERKITREDYARAEAEMKKMVAEGKITKEDMNKRLGEMRKVMGGSRDFKKEDWPRIKKRIEGAVKSGKMTREEADKMLEGFKKRIEMSEGKRDECRDCK